MSIVRGYLRYLISDHQYPIIIGYLILVVVILCVGWMLTRRIEDKRKRIFWRSAVLAVAFAPGFFGAGHGGIITPALLSAIILIGGALQVFLSANWSNLLDLPVVLFLFAVGPMLATWFVILSVWRVCVERSTEARSNVLYIATAGAGVIVWLGIPNLSGEHPAWESDLYFLVGIPPLVVLAGVLGYLEPKRVWRWGLIPFGAQAVVAVVLDFAPAGEVLPLVLLVFLGLSIPSLIAAYVGGRIARRMDKAGSR